jgi:hypothetical protein
MTSRVINNPPMGAMLRREPGAVKQSPRLPSRLGGQAGRARGARRAREPENPSRR